MAKKRIAILGTAVLAAAILLAGGLGLYRAVRHVPPFYRRAVGVSPAGQRTASDMMVQKAAALVSDLDREGTWEAVFTEEEINGWLAVDLVENHPGALPGSFTAPRVHVEPERLTVACRFDDGRFHSVLWLAIEAYLAEPNVLALRIRKVRAGMLPLPLGEVLDQISQAARRMELQLRWQQRDGDPVALIALAPQADEKKRVVVESLALGEGDIYLAGRTESR